MVLASAQHETGEWQRVALGQAGPPLAPFLWDLLGWDCLHLQDHRCCQGVPSSCPLWVLVWALSPCSSRIRAPVLGLCVLSVSGPRTPLVFYPWRRWLLLHWPQPPFCHFSNRSPTTPNAFLFPLPVFNPAHSKISPSLTSSRCLLPPSFNSLRISLQECSSYFLFPHCFPSVGFTSPARLSPLPRTGLFQDALLHDS